MNKAFIFDIDGVLIDSEKVWAGIKSAMASKAYTIALTSNLIDGYSQINANERANNMIKVIELVKKRLNLS